MNFSVFPPPCVCVSLLLHIYLTLGNHDATLRFTFLACKSKWACKACVFSFAILLNLKEKAVSWFSVA